MNSNHNQKRRTEIPHHCRISVLNCGEDNGYDRGKSRQPNTAGLDGKDQNGQQYNGYAQLPAECLSLRCNGVCLASALSKRQLENAELSLTVISFTRVIRNYSTTNRDAPQPLRPGASLFTFTAIIPSDYCRLMMLLIMTAACARLAIPFGANVSAVMPFTMPSWVSRATASLP